jgi:23S rRNA (guanine745-N1)-methyltransferase
MPESYHKVIKQDGFFICVNTGEKHLIELREKLYDKITKVEFDPIKNMGDDFELVDQQQVSYQNTLSSQQQIQDLLLMTPHNWRTKAENKESLSTLEELTVTIDAQIHVFKAKAKTIEDIAEVEIETERKAEKIFEEKPANKINPWGKTTEEITAPSDIPEIPVEIVTELPAAAPVEMPVKSQTEMPVETPAELPSNKEETASSKNKINPWLK